MSYIYSRNQPLSQPQSTLPARGRPTSGSGRGPPLSAYSSIGHLGGSPSNASPSGRRSQPSDFWNMQRNNQHHSSTRLIKRPAGEFPVHIYHFHDVRCSHTSQPTHDRQLRATDYSIYRVPTAGRAQPAAAPPPPFPPAPLRRARVGRTWRVDGQRVRDAARAGR